MSIEHNPKTGEQSVLAQWKNRKRKTGSRLGLIPRKEEQIPVPSFAQQRLWLLQQMDIDNPFYQYGHIYKINGPLNSNFLKKSLQLIIDRHEILRTNFIHTARGVELKITPNRQLQLGAFDVSKRPNAKQEQQAYDIANQEVIKTYDLSKDFLLRLAIIKFSETNYWLVMSMHHIIGDKGSMDILTKELFSAYQSYCQGTATTLKALSVQYADFALWQRTQKTRSEDLNYWVNKLSGALPVLDLPLDHKRPRKLTYRGAVLSHKLSPELSAQLRKLAKDRGTTLFVLMLTAFKILLYRYTNQKDVIIGSPFINRDKVELEKLLGFFNETLVLRTQFSDELGFNDCLALVKKTSLEAFEHKNVPFDELVRAIQPTRYENSNPLFQAMFLFNKASERSWQLDKLEIEEEVMDIGVSKFDLSLFATDHDDYIENAFEFSLDLFEKSTIESMLTALELILKGIVDNPSLSINRIPILAEEEERKILVNWNNTAVPMPDFYPVYKSIEGMASLFPDKTAVVFQDKSLTYLELYQQANIVAAYLIDKGIKSNTLIGLYMDRGVEMIVGILAILKARAAYIPLDPNYPADRIAYMLADSKTSIILTLSTLKDKIATDNTIETICIDTIDYLTNGGEQNTASQSNFSLETQKTDQAYVIYTSGSTGLPKGVSISHENLWHSTLARFYFYPSKPESFLLLSSFSFDSSIAGIFWTLCSGGKLVISPKRIEQDTFLLSNLIARHKVSHTLMLPSLYAAILTSTAPEKLVSLKNVIVAGEACSQTLINQHFDSLKTTDLYNEYGPTEASVWCIVHPLSPNEKAFIPIGKPISNTQTYILNKQLQVVPIGVAGELYIGGMGLSKGYLGRPGLTKEKFISHPFSRLKDERIYKTGDLARYHKDGCIEFLGRVDSQVKIRGFRVELGEIEKVLAEHHQLNEAIVIVHKAGNNQRLVAYVAPNKGVETVPFESFLKGRLPHYMIPSLFMELEAFPRLPNGKIDRNALPDPRTYKLITTYDFVAPTTLLQQQLVDIWEAVLTINPIGINDNFFSIGGDSILSIQIVSKARDTGIVLRPNQLFEHQTIAALAKSIEQKEAIQTDLKETVLIKNPNVYPLSYLQKAFLFSSNKEQEDQGLLQLEFTIEGTIDYPAFQAAWQQTTMRHDTMRTVIKVENNHVSQQYILADAQLKWEQRDWQNKTKSEQEKALSELKKEDKKKPLSFEEPPISRMYFIRLEADKNLLFWTCHHILLDGWSCGVILKDALTFYEANRVGEELNLNTLPNYPAFLEWKKRQNKKPAEQYWLEELKEFRKPLLFGNKKMETVEQTKRQFANKTHCLSKEESTALKQFAQQNKISVSTLFQAAWGLLLGQYFNTNDVLFGLTVSGRFADFPNIESTSGLFMNVLPNRLKIDGQQTIVDFLQKIQKEQGRKTQFESTTFDEIQRIANWPSHVELFDCLFVFGNFLKDGLTVGKLSINHFKGGFSSSYPLTIRINPLSAIEIDWRYDTSRINQQEIDWMQQQFRQLITSFLTTTPDLHLNELTDGINIDFLRPILTDCADYKPLSKKEHFSFVPPRNLVESQLCEIWETLFNKKNIGIEDNFFDLGGGSLMAIQLFTEIESKMGKVLPPASLFQYPTIYMIGQLINNGKQVNRLSAALVPLQDHGNKPPLFCLHSGGGHVFFYQDFATHFPDNQPVYSLQPKGLDGKEAFYKTIEEMAEHYIKAIKTRQPHGPYYLLGTCFSNAVALEMVNQLKAKGDEVAMLAIIDSAPVHLFGQLDKDKNHTFTRFLDMLKRGDFTRIKSKIVSRLTRQNKSASKDILVETAAQKNLRLTIESLNQLYADYSWKPYDGKIQFIRSSEFNDRKDKKYHLTQWTKLALKGLEVSIVPGHHLTLFDEPDEVKTLAHKVNECIEMANM